MNMAKQTEIQGITIKRVDSLLYKNLKTWRHHLLLHVYLLIHSCTFIHEIPHIRIVFPVRLQIFTMSPFSEMQLQQT